MVPKTAGAPSPSSAPPRRSPNGSSSTAPPPPPPAAWEGGDGRRGRYYAQPPLPPPQQQQRPHAYADPYLYSRGDPRGPPGGERSAGAPPPAALGGGRGHGGSRGSRAAHADDEIEDDGVFPHYSAPAGADRRGDHRGGGGGHGVHGGPPPPAWSRQQHLRQQQQQQHQYHQQQHQQLHPTRGGVKAAVDGQVVSASRPVADAVVAAAAASGDRAEGRGPGGGEGRGVRGGGRSRAVAPTDDYYDHPFYQREREPLLDGGMVRGGAGGRGGGGRGSAGRVIYSDTGLPIGATPGSTVEAGGGRRPYPGPPPPGARDRAERPSNGGQGTGSPRVHPMGPIERGEPLPPRYARSAQPPGINQVNQALFEAVERIFRHREKHGAGGAGRDASPSVAADGPKADTMGADERGLGGRGASSPVLDAKKATMRIIGIMESFDGRLDDVMADARARAELDAIFPGVKERDFRALLEGCIDRSQVRASYFLFCIRFFSSS